MPPLGAPFPRLSSGRSMVSPRRHPDPVGIQIGLIAGTREVFEPLAVEDRNIAAPATDQLARLQRACGGRDADATHAKHEGEEFLGHVERVSMRAILGHQQPACEASFHDMEARARGRLCELAQDHIDVTTVSYTHLTLPTSDLV